MITVIGETNFAFDILFERDYASSHILKLAKQGKIKLVLPAFSLAELEGQALEIINNRKEKLNSFASILKEISRSKYSKDDAKSGLEIVKRLLESNKKDYKKIGAAIQKLSGYCYVIKYSPEIIASAELRFRQRKPPFKETDCKVYQSILQFLTKNKKEKVMFITKDRDDFDHPEIRNELKELDCELYFSSGDVIKRIMELTV